MPDRNQGGGEFPRAFHVFLSVGVDMSVYLSAKVGSQSVAVIFCFALRIHPSCLVMTNIYGR